MNEAKIVGASGGAIGLGALALGLGACCVSPWAVSLLGVGGAVLLARLAFLQPYLVLATLLLLGSSLWLLHARQAPADQACRPASRARLRWLVWSAAGVVALLDLASFAPRFLS